MNEPSLVLADEPTGNLDRHTAQHIASLLGDLVRTHGIILVLATHSLEVARRFSRIYELIDGLLHQQTT
jgi:lipoprotein-releasing system ATP-binding protein